MLLLLLMLCYNVSDVFVKFYFIFVEITSNKRLTKIATFEAVAFRRSIMGFTLIDGKPSLFGLD